MKKFLLILTIAAILLTSVVSFAEEIGDGSLSIIQGDIMAINELDERPAVFSPITDKQIIDGTIAGVEEGRIIIDNDSNFAINTDENTIIINEKMQVITLADVKENSKIRVIASAMETRSIPPQSYGYVVMISEAEQPLFPIYAEVAKIATGEGFTLITSADGQYIVRVTPETIVTKLNGEKVAEVKAGDTILFSTSILTFSIPAQGNADSIVVLNSAAEVAEEKVTNLDKVVVNGKEITTKVIDGETTLVHVRAISETLGYEVAWDNQLFAVAVGTVPMGVNFKIGENRYNKAKMMPATLSAAPQLINDLTYVPVDFFSEILEAEVTIVDGVLNIK
ncbi:MAG: copper amine oxidase N-terminal domain-containing protein [Eubacteriales bacterium]|nr:copper amine oxidase N-terminal domain-containing protein [Eubacteriales bacterium]